ncbi:hypothetical protein B0H34DRAFT_676307 [Crassisporium funariophilum]|nr:hypothetical protein B0H34DRAFT_676307 [Crassisporium funariophilum]
MNHKTRANAPLHRCLHAIADCLCPVPACKQLFARDQVRKLLVKRLEATDEHREADFLQQLALAGADDVPQQQLRHVLREVDGWLRDRPDDSFMPLRSARAAIGSYAGLRDAKNKLKKEVRELRAKGHERDRVFERFEAKNQPLDGDALTQAYLEEYRRGFADGQVSSTYWWMEYFGQCDGRMDGRGEEREEGESGGERTTETGRGGGRAYEQDVLPSATAGEGGPSSSVKSGSNTPRQYHEGPHVRREMDANTGQLVAEHSRLASMLDRVGAIPNSSVRPTTQERERRGLGERRGEGRRMKSGVSSFPDSNANFDKTA